MTENFWGKSALIDMHGCNEKVDKPEEIRKFVDELCKNINMKRHGELHIDKFGDGDLEGHSFMQFIETSSITGHFDDKKGKTNRAFIDIFSCKNFDEKKASEFCKDFFS